MKIFYSILILIFHFSWLSSASDVALQIKNMEEILPGKYRPNIGFISQSDDVLPNGEYSHRVLKRANEIASYIFDTTAGIIDFTTIQNNILGDIFANIKSSMGIDVDKIKAQVFKQLMMEQTLVCISYNVKPAESLPEKESTAFKVKVLAYESTHFKLEIPERPALILFEFLYRNSPEDCRYQKAFLNLYSSITRYDSIRILFEKIVNFYDPSRNPLPVMTARFDDFGVLLQPYIDFIQNLFKKVTELIDPLDDKDLYTQHVSTIISCILTCKEIDPFMNILLEVLPNIDPLHVLQIPGFVDFFVDKIAGIDLKNTKLLLVDFLMGYFRTDDVMDRMTEDLFIGYNTIVKAARDQGFAGISYLTRLSKENQRKSLDLLKSFNKYDTIMGRAETYKFLTLSFNDLQKNHLEALKLEIDELIENFPKLNKFYPKRLAKIQEEIALVLRKILNLALKNKTLDLNYEKFTVFLALSKVLLFREPIPKTSNGILNHLLNFFNQNIDHDQHKFTEEFVASVRNQIYKVFVENRMILNNIELLVYHKFFRLTANGGDQEFMAIYTKILKSPRAVKENVDLVRTIADALKISAQQTLFTHLIEEIKEYIKFFARTKIPINAYKQGRLIILAELLIKYKELGKTEIEFVNTIISKYRFKVFLQ